MPNLVLNLLNFKKGRTLKDGPKWLFTTTVLEVSPGRAPKSLCTINGCMYAAARIVRTPGGGSPARGYFRIVEWCQEWLDEVKASLEADEIIQEYLKEVDVDRPADPDAVPDLMLNVPVVSTLEGAE